TQVREVMHVGERIPLVPQGTGMRQAILEISQKGFGCVGVLAPDGRLCGIITDGDLRRQIDGDLLSRNVDEVMTRRPRMVSPDTLVATGRETINASAITSLMVVEAGRPAGLVHLHDLLRIGAA